MARETASDGEQDGGEVKHYGTEEHRDDASVATRFTTDHGLNADGSEKTLFAFICPQCDARNPLQGDPKDFGNKPFACEECGYTSLLLAESVNEFAEQEVEAVDND